MGNTQTSRARKRLDSCSTRDLGFVHEIEIDTAHFKGNFPDKCSIQAALVEKGLDVNSAENWKELMPKQNLSADAIHKSKNRQRLRSCNDQVEYLSRWRCFKTKDFGKAIEMTKN